MRLQLLALRLSLVAMPVLLAAFCGGWKWR
jgi:hypothetical protein